MIIRTVFDNLQRLTCLKPLAIRRLSNSIADKRLVYISTSQDIISNLAFEEWLYEHKDLSNTDILLLWQNGPTVVIGRHQNPWMEANVPYLEREDVTFVRRSSGGGAVYHDEGNLNLSFLKAHARYNRRENLSLVINALSSRWDIDLRINDRDDIILDEFYKISGTAAKVGRTQTYHHFTLLQNVHKDRLANMLSSCLQSTKSKSTKSVIALVKNLSEVAPSVTLESMVDAITDEFSNQAEESRVIYVNPNDEEQFPGISKICQRLKSWEWMYGKTPQFSIKRMFSNSSLLNEPLNAEIFVSIEKACVSSLTFQFNDSSLIDLQIQLINVFEREFVNMRLTKINVNNLIGKYINFKESFCNWSVEQKIISWIVECLNEFFIFL